MIDPNKTYQVGIKGLVFNDEHKIMLVQEADGMWELPGGRMEHGETFEQTLKREIKEEMGVECDILDQHPYWAWIRRMRSDGMRTAILCFRIKLNSFDFITTDECVGSAYFDKQGLIDLGDKLYAKALIKFL